MSHAPVMLVLASTSPHRRALLERLGLPFAQAAPGVDETPRPGEDASALVARLARDKARAVAPAHRDALIVGSDQVSVLDGMILGKPGSARANVEQLERAAGREVLFLTGLCLHDSRTGDEETAVEPFRVTFRSLQREQIEQYVARDPVAMHCAGGFRSEGLGCALFQSMAGEDPSALVGLPLIRLVAMLERRGLDVLGAASPEGAT